MGLLPEGWPHGRQRFSGWLWGSMSQTNNEFPITDNLLLSHLTREQHRVLSPDLQLVKLELGQTLHAPDEKIKHVYFPTTSVISLLASLDNGDSVETGLIGSEGIVGTSIALGVDAGSSLALVQGTGVALRLPSLSLPPFLRNGGIFRQKTFEFINSLFAQTAQTAACNRAHTVSQRLARWLLLTHDRVEGDELELTHELIARMLGSRRAGVSVAANDLREAGLISYTRGRVTVIDRTGLEAASCECYRMVKSHFDRLKK